MTIYGARERADYLRREVGEDDRYGDDLLGPLRRESSAGNRRAARERAARRREAEAERDARAESDGLPRD